jgi:hypothetical protein
MSDPARIGATATGTPRPAARRTLALVVAVTLVSTSPGVTHPGHGRPGADANGLCT